MRPRAAGFLVYPKYVPFSRYKRIAPGSLNNLLLNELLNLSRKCAVVRDDVASIRVYNCNVALNVNFARADQSFVDVCLPTLESLSIPVLSRSLYAEASSEMSSPEAVL